MVEASIGGFMRITKRPKHIKCSHCGNETSVVPHGTNTAYVTYGCRCDACRDARRAYDKRVKGTKRYPYTKQEPIW